MPTETEAPPIDFDDDLGNEEIGRAIRWALKYIGAEDKTLDDAPSEMAYALWEWGHGAKTKAMELFLRYIGNQKDSRTEERQALEDDNREHLKRLNKLSVKCPHCGEALA